MSLDAVLNEYFSADGPGVVLLVHSLQHGEEIATLGYADVAKKTAVQPNDQFRIGGITKSFVGMLYVKLAQEKIVALEDTMSRWLPDEILADIPHSNLITIRHLLNMTSGIYDYLGSEDFWEDVHDDPTYPWTPDDVLEYIYEEEPYFEPGKGYEYSNSNYVLLELILEEATGLTFAEVLREKILEPLLLDDIYVEHIESPTGNLITSYADTNDDGNLENARDFNDGTGMADAGLIARAEDLARFVKALYYGESLTIRGRDQLLDTVDAQEGGRYGLGVQRLSTPWADMWGHDGQAAGFMAQMWYLPETDTTVVALTNSEANELSHEFLTAVLADRLGAR